MCRVDPDPREPGNLRTLALPLKIILESVPDRPDLTVQLHIDDDVFTIVSTRANLEVRYGDTSEPADLVVRTGYEAFLDVSDGSLPFEDFTTRHVEVIQGSQNVDAFYNLMRAAMKHEH
jgi:hypothetical protein